MRQLAYIVLAVLATISGASAQGAWSTAQSLPGVWSAAAAFGDYTGDGLPDLVLTGQTGPADGGVRIARVYRNTAGAFRMTDMPCGMIGWSPANPRGLKVRTIPDTG